MGTDSPSIEFEPLPEFPAGKPGGYLESLSKTRFADSKMASGIAPLIEAGAFDRASQEIHRALSERRINVEYTDERTNPQGLGTRVVGKVEVMLLPKDFRTLHPAAQVFEILHRNMSLILQRENRGNGETSRQDPFMVKQLLEMGIACARAVRLGATKLRREDQKKQVKRIADYLEQKTVLKLNPLVDALSRQAA